MRLFDTHVHLDDERYDSDREALIAALPGAGVERCVTIGADMNSSRAALALAARYPGQLRAAVGVHPHEAEQVDEENLAQLGAWLQDPMAVAMGEIGLDYYYDAYPRPRQMEAMDRQWILAKDLNKPVIFHVREAWGDFLPWLRRHPGSGVMHCFTGSRESARECLDAGLMIAFGGAVTFKNANKLLEAAAYVPEDRLLLETDCPYLSPVPYRGKRNEPARVALVAERLAQLRGVAVEALAEACFANACQVFGWREE